MKKVFIIGFFLILFTSCASFYYPAILKNNSYSSYDFSFKWSYSENSLNLKLTNIFWIGIFDLEVSVRPVDDNLKPIGKYKRFYIGDVGVDKSVNIKVKFKEKNIKLIQVDYTYNYPGYHSAYDSLNYNTVYLTVK